MKDFKHRRDPHYLKVLRERLTIDGPNGLLARAVPVLQGFDYDEGHYNRCCRIDFSGISANNLVDSGQNFVSSSVADCFESLFREAGRLNENGVFVKLRFLLVYPYSPYAISRIQAESSRNRSSMEDPQYRRNLQLVDSVDEETFKQSFLVRAQTLMLDQIQEWADTNAWTTTTLNKIIVRFAPIDPCLCALIVNDTVFTDGYLYSKEKRSTMRCATLAPLVQVDKKDNPQAFAAFEDHFRYLWDLDVTLYSDDATYYRRNEPGTLHQVKTPDKVRFDAKASRIRNKMEPVTDEEVRRWRLTVTRLLRRYSILPAPTSNTESLFITCSWKQGHDKRSVPNDNARELSRMLEEDFGRTRDESLLDVHIMEGVPGDFLTRQLYSRLDQSTLGLILLTADLEGADGRFYCKPNVYHELGYLMKHLEPERLMIIREEGTEFPSNISDVIRVEFPTGKLLLAYREILEWLARRCSFEKTIEREALEKLTARIKYSTTNGKITQAEGNQAKERVEGDLSLLRT